MTQNEVVELLHVLKVNYPNSFRIDIELKKKMVLLWTEAFKNDRASDVVKAVKEIIYTDTREFAPNIAQIKARMKPSFLALENNQSLMKKYDKDFDENYQYREDEMSCLILRNINNVPKDEQKIDYKQCVGIDLETVSQEFYKYVGGLLSEQC